MTASKYVPRGVSPLPWSTDKYGNIRDASGQVVAVGMYGDPDCARDFALAALAASQLGPLAEALEELANHKYRQRRSEAQACESAVALLSSLARAVAEIDGAAQ